jgi:hypothetical protein
MTDPALSPGDQATIIGVGAAVLLAVSGGLWKAASLRGDLNARWKKRVDFAIARIDELIGSELEVLRNEIDAFLPTPERFDPVQVVADPALLSQRAAHVVKLYRIRQHLESDLAHSRSVGPALIAALGGLELAVLALTAFYGELLTGAVFRVGGLVLLTVGVVLLVAVTAMYIFFQQRLSTGEIEAGTDIKESELSK